MTSAESQVVADAELRTSLAATLAAARATVRHAVARRRDMGWLACGCLVGMAAGSGVAAASTAFPNSQIAQILQAQATARATERVQLGILNRVSASDFAAPHTRDKLAAVQARLDPILERMSSDGSGIISDEVIAADGIVVYSDQPGQTGRRIPGAQRAPLNEALAGYVISIVDPTPDRDESPAEAAYDSTLDVYVPVSMDGAVVGAYEMHFGLTGLRSNQSLALIPFGGALGILLHLLLRLAGAHIRRDAGRPAMSTAQQPTTDRRFTQRELQVLELLAAGHSYRGVATELILSEETIRSHVKRILRKTGQPNRVAAVTMALRMGVIRLSAERTDGPSRADSPPRVGPSRADSPPRVGPSRQIHPDGGSRAGLGASNVRVTSE